MKELITEILKLKEINQKEILNKILSDIPIFYPNFSVEERLLIKNKIEERIKEIEEEEKVQQVAETIKNLKNNSEKAHYIALHIAEKNKLAYDETTDEFYVWNSKWTKISDIEIEEKIKEITQTQFSIRLAQETKQNLKIFSNRTITKIEPPLRLIPLKESMYDIIEKTILDYEEHYFFPSCIPHIFNPDAECPEILNFLDGISNSPEQKQLLLDLAAYCLYRDNPFQVSFFLIGSGANGKSTFLSLITKLLGENNVVHYPFQFLEKNRFLLANLKNKYANIFADLPRTSLSSVSFFKTLTGQDTVSAEKKFKQQSIEFRNFAKMIFSANTFPTIYDDSNAFYRRIIVVEFEKIFEGEKADPNLIEKITTKEEIEGFLRLCLERLPILLKDGFQKQTIDQTREAYVKRSNSILYFISEMVEDEGPGMEQERIYLAYRKFCDEKKLLAETYEFFARQFVQLCLQEGLRARKKRNNKKTIIEGISIKQESHGGLSAF